MLIKHEYPILERDTEKTAVIMPDRKNLYKFPLKCVFAFLGSTIGQYAEANNAEKIGESCKRNPFKSRSNKSYKESC